MKKEQELLYYELVPFIPEEHENLLYMLLEAISYGYVKEFKTILTAQEVHCVRVFISLLTFSYYDYPTNLDTAKEMLNELGIPSER